jgi:phospholipid/cholesterol/gamma-HCH transport system substrate-binding protein
MIRLTAEVKTGIMVVCCFAILVWLVAKTGDFTIFTGDEGYNIKVVFGFASGIAENAPVRLAGVEVGKVERIDLEYQPETRAVLTLWLKSDTKIRKDSQAHINTLGLMGEKYIEVTAGKAEEFLKEGDVIIGEEPFQMEKLFKKGEKLAEQMDMALTDFRALTKNLNGVVTDNKQGINNIVLNLDATSVNFRDFSEDIKDHPWKLLMKGKETTESSKKTDRGKIW